MQLSHTDQLNQPIINSINIVNSASNHKVVQFTGSELYESPQQGCFVKATFTAGDMIFSLGYLPSVDEHKFSRMLINKVNSIGAIRFDSDVEFTD